MSAAMKARLFARTAREMSTPCLATVPKVAPPLLAPKDGAVAPDASYSADESTLLVGEGSLGFTTALVRAIGTGKRVTATTLESREGLHPAALRAAQELARLEDPPRLMHDVTVSQLGNVCVRPQFDRVVFNQPPQPSPLQHY